MTVYAHLLNGELRGVYDLLPKDWGDITNFDTKCIMNPDLMSENGFVKIIRDTTPFNPETHKMSDFPWYTIENGQVIEHRDIIELSPTIESPQQ